MMKLGRKLVTRSGRWTVTKVSDRTRLTELLERLHPVLPEQQFRRIGPAGDGGYLLPDDLDDIAACFSPGVGDLSGFELDCVELGMRAHLADASVASPEFADERLDFLPKFIRAVPDAESTTLAEWVAATEPHDADDLLLQIDIEGDEWGVFLGAPASLLRRFRVIVAEFHDLQGLHSADSFSLQALTFEKLLESHTCVHIHPNNAGGVSSVAGVSLPRIAEFTFLRNDRIDRSRARFATQFPHPLDAENVDRRSPLPLPSSMYRSN
jgi:hypothetical protein